MMCTETIATSLLKCSQTINQHGLTLIYPIKNACLLSGHFYVGAICYQAFSFNIFECVV